MSPPKRPRRARRDFFGEGHFRAFLEACEALSKAWLRDFAEFGVLTGMRPGEIRQLRRNAVTLRAGIVHENAEYGLIQLAAGETKTGEARTVLLVPAAREILDRQPVSMRHPNLYFLGHHGRPITKGSLRHHFNEARKRAGLAVARPHMTRHTAASWMVQRGVPLPFIKEILGHRDIRTTEGYAHMLPQHLAPAMAALAQRAV